MKLPASIKVSTSGIRGKMPGELNLETAGCLIKSFLQTLPDNGSVVLAEDMRPMSKELRQLATQLVIESKKEPLIIGLSPLPTTQVAIKHFRALAGINFTASHNPLPYHGLKLLNFEGEFITQDTLDQMLGNLELDTNPSNQLPPIQSTKAPKQHEAYQAHLNQFPNKDFGFKVAIDAVNGAGSYLLPQLLEKLGCSVVKIACDPTNPPHRELEPTAINLEETGRQIAELNVDIGLAVDPDADRLVLIKSDGEVLSEEYTLALSAWQMLRSGYKPIVITNLSTGSLIDHVAEICNAQVLRSPVGEPNVVSEMKKRQADVGGEGNGGVIDGTRHLGRDSLVGTFHILSLLHETKQSLGELVSQLPQLYLLKEQLSIIGQVLDTKITLLNEAFSDADLNELDGWYYRWPDKSWIHIRKSNTEPIIRVFSESSNESTARQRLDEALKIIVNN